MSALRSKFHGRAVRLGQRIMAAEPHVQAVLLYGSVVTDRVHPGSDIDLIIFSAEPISGRELKKKVPALRKEDINLSFQTPESLKKSYQYDWSFLACLSDTAEVIAGDPDVMKLFKRRRPKVSVTHGQMSKFARDFNSASILMSYNEELRRKGEPPDSIMGDDPLPRSLYELYRNMRQGLILAAAARGEAAWSRSEAFAATENAYPQLKKDLAHMAALEPHWEAYHRHRPAPTPPSVQAVKKATASGKAIFDFLLAQLDEQISPKERAAMLRRAKAEQDKRARQSELLKRRRDKAREARWAARDREGVV